MIGTTREQVVDRLGEPRSVITAGNREILFFPRERVVLRGGVVIEVEPLASDTPAATSRRPAAPPASAPAPAETPRAPTPAPAPPPVSPEAAANPTSSEIAKNLPADMPPVVAPPATPEGPPPALEIKSVRPKGAATRPAPKQEAPAPAPVAETPKAEPPPVAPPPAPSTRAVKQAPRPPTAEELAAKAEADAKKEKSRLLRRRLDDANLEEPDENLFTGTTYVLAFVLIGGGVGYLLWQRSQRQIELAATAVSRTPFNAPAATGGGARFTTELLGKLDWKRFENLVAAYYNKTGVVATRTQTGPESPVHIRISWKGEPRPFACVQCIAHPDGLVDAARLQELVTVLAAEDIRRGYVVTTGKFSVAARDLAEEKHLTLMSGDILLDKLNALPDAARAEVMQETTASDEVTPS